MNIFLGILIPFIGTSLGAVLVFFMKNEISNRIEKVLLGIASGVMIAASIWSLLIPSIEQSGDIGYIKWIPPAVGFLLGIIFLIFIDIIVRKMDNSSKKIDMLFFSVTLHNIPEGMAVGMIMSGVLSNIKGITMVSAMTLALGIAIQNLPEGAIISMPLIRKGYSKYKSFLFGILSGVVEPIFAIITIILTNFVGPLLPFFLSFAAGAMIYAVVHELIPEASVDRDNIVPFSVGIGFVLMMILDITLS